MTADEVAASLRAFDILWEAGYSKEKITMIIEVSLSTGRDPVTTAQRMIALAKAAG